MNIRLLMLTVFLLGCSANNLRAPQAEAPPTDSRAELPANVHWVRNSAEYKAVVLQTYRLAGERLRQLVATKEPGTWAVASDADETIIDNSLYAKELALAGRESTSEGWDSWVARRAAPPLPGAVAFLELVHDLGGRIAIVTNRIEDHCADTRANFRAFDIPFDVMLCRIDDRQKEARWQQVEQGNAAADLPPLEIVLWLGDNIGDFPDLDQRSRLRDQEAFDRFGDRYIAFPNPMYGSWEDNPYD